MKFSFKNKAMMVTGLLVAAFSLFLSWYIQQPNAIVPTNDTMQLLTYSGILLGVTTVIATLVAVRLASRRD